MERKRPGGALMLGVNGVGGIETFLERQGGGRK